jgi:hypothetical protein
MISMRLKGRIMIAIGKNKFKLFTKCLKMYRFEHMYPKFARSAYITPQKDF